MKKSIALIGVLFLFSFNTYQEPKKVKVELTLPQAELILKALSKLPYEETVETINTIYSQVRVQVADTTKQKK
jgi:hypothetical protein